MEICQEAKERLIHKKEYEEARLQEERKKIEIEMGKYCLFRDLLKHNVCPFCGKDLIRKRTLNGLIYNLIEMGGCFLFNQYPEGGWIKFKCLSCRFKKEKYLVK